MLKRSLAEEGESKSTWLETDDLPEISESVGEKGLTGLTTESLPDPIESDGEKGLGEGLARNLELLANSESFGENGVEEGLTIEDAELLPDPIESPGEKGLSPGSDVTDSARDKEGTPEGFGPAIETNALAVLLALAVPSVVTAAPPGGSMRIGDGRRKGDGLREGDGCRCSLAV
jgi:hypothetical protein